MTRKLLRRLDVSHWTLIERITVGAHAGVVVGALYLGARYVFVHWLRRA